MHFSDSQPDRNIVYSPSPGSYAIIRLNPVEMVRRFDDPQALLQAQAMRSKSYLVYLYYELALPFPNQPWYRFEVEPIATSLRPEDTARGITPDMCIPIFPNTTHPNGREPLQPQPEGLFPYNNCYHWFEAKAVNVRIRARSEEFDETHAVKLNARSRIQMQRLWLEDGARLPDIVEEAPPAQSQHEAAVHHSARAPAIPPRSSPEIPVPSDTDLAHEHGPLSDAIESNRRLPTAFDDYAEGASIMSELTVTHSEQSNNSVEDIAAMDIFSGPNDDVELVPLVDLWISELGDQLKQEDIPDPQEMYAEFDHIAKIIREARVRSYAALTVLPHPFDDGPTIDMGKTGKSRKRTLFGISPVKPWGKLRTRVKRLSTRLENMFRLPYILIWP
ncbi:hypothetical protein C8Q73DRAFT_707024 [Cubamyces lactineus]|nr:hypothetical protein C8Q73DRAFT_707024 [Cubamyces lactineus]